jgi:hypothetical protein
VKHELRDRRAIAATLFAGMLAACSSSEPKGPNRACFRALDCQDGLVCVEGRCTSDIAPIVPEGAGTAAPPGEDAPDAGTNEAY